MSVVIIHFIKALMLMGGVALIFAWRVYDRYDIKGGRIWFYVISGLMAFVSIFAYFDFGHYPKFGQFLNPHDFFHYYMGSKYSEEVGYDYLYESVLVAHAEMHGGQPQHSGLRRMDDYGFSSPAQVLREKEKYKALFTPERWEEFKQDIVPFREMVTERRWRGILQDKGYNATPVWNQTARIITNAVPSERVGYLVFLDLSLIALMFMLVGWAFGLRTMLLFIIFFCLLWPMAYTHNRGAFLRLDWSTMTVMGICFLKKRWFVPAGIIMAYAASARIFPAVFAFGLGAKMLGAPIVERKIPWRHVRYWAAFGVTAVLLVGATLVTDGIAHWQSFFQKIQLHDHDLSGMRVGFKYVFLNSFGDQGLGWGAWEAKKMALFEQNQTLWWSVQAGVLLLTFFLVQKLEDYESVALCYIPAFFLFAPTFYYQVMMMIPLFLFLPKIERSTRAAGAAMLFGISIVLYVLNQKWHIVLELSYLFSFMLLVLCIYMATIAFVAFGERTGFSVSSADESTGRT